LFAFPVFALLCVAFVGLAAGLALLAPVACGSGIHHIKATLNGIRVPGALSLRTLAVKLAGATRACPCARAFARRRSSTLPLRMLPSHALARTRPSCARAHPSPRPRLAGITLVVASGLPAGREGPMVQIGACVAAAILGCYRRVLGALDVSPSAQARLLDEDSHLRDYVSIGTAAGIAAAFNAPIGGVLFALEEVSTVWSNRLTFRCFFASIVGAVTSNWLVSGRKHGVIEADALVVYVPARS
jgi:H+/Cl- antiporter ClcA